MNINEENIKPLSNRFYVSCPICGAILLQAKIVKDGIIKCERCHKRSWIEIQDGKVTAIPLNQKDKSASEM